MHIAVDARYINISDKEDLYFTLALFQKLIQSRPCDQFTIITPQAGLLSATTNSTELFQELIPKNYFQLRNWYSKTLPELLKKLGADTFISINGATVKSAIPQVVFLSSPLAAEQPFMGKAFFFLYKKYLAKQIAKAKAVATFTNLQQHFIATYLRVQPTFITPVGYAVPDIYKPADWQQQETILLNHTNGSEYFLYIGSFVSDTFMLVLKAFSLFKKRQLSNMQLIAAGQFVPDNNLLEKLSTYKYKADVKLYDNLDVQTLAPLTAAAYAVIWLDEKALTSFSAVAAVQCQVPVISLEKNTAIPQMAEQATLYVDTTPESLAEQMKRVYKDENLRKQLVANAALQLPQVNGTVAAQKFWDCIAMATT